MLKFLLKRTFMVSITLFLVSFLTFIIMNITPGDTAETILRHTFIGIDDPIKESDVEFVRDKFELSRPLYKQYFDWLKNAFKGDFGNSSTHSISVSSLIFKRLPYSICLGIVLIIFSILIAIPIGLISAFKQNKLFDHITRIISLIFYCVPGFFIAIFLIILFSLKLDMFPVSGVNNGIKSYILPTITLSLPTIAYMVRMMRQSSLDVINQEYIRIAKAKGLTNSEIIRKHVLRNAILPIITVIGLQIGHIFSGSVIAETIFQWPGIGSLLIESIKSKDFNVVQICIIIITFGYTITNFIVDIVYMIIDPRIKYSSDGDIK